MEDSIKCEDHLISAAAFVEGGVQDACDDACSICLEAFSENDPPTVTGCKHDFHLQCILEWCQRSSQCPMCWQSINLKDPSSQELLDAIEQERNIANNPSINTTTIFHHPTFGDFELQHLPASATAAELEERIIQHLAAAAAMGRARHIARREGHRSRTSANVRSRYIGLSTTQPSIPSPTRPTLSDDVEPTTPIVGPASPLVSSIVPARPPESPTTDRSGMQSSPNNQDRAGPSEPFSDFKTRVNAISMRYKESITKTTKTWKERLFSRNNTPTEHGPREGSAAGMATLSRMIDHLQQDLSPVSSNTNSSPFNQDQNDTVAPTVNNSATQNQVTGSPPADSAIQ
ncbi:E3 ubiquitin-protein ligase RHF2A-like [Rutidosis leptorrhynchoides]|uniref:E3 ubiquitin-protein ligase RHF2A-like n=1 Tax=Rutidosis leptorrhynchoides TaxID=125765 RepID=UPI003A990001